MIFTFDPPEVWSLNAQAHVEPNALAPTQPNCLRLQFGSFDPAASHVLSGLVVGQQYRVWVRCNFDAVDEGAPINVSFQYLSTVFVSLAKDISAIGWELRDCGLMTYGEVGFPETADGLFRIVGHQNFNPGQVLIDAIYIGESPFVIIEAAIMAHKWNAIQAALNNLALINGSDGGYYTNLEGRVYTRLFTPIEESSAQKPYLCLPLDQEGERPTFNERMFSNSWSQVGHVFFDDNYASDKRNSDGAISAAKFRDDLMRCVMLDTKLSGLVKDLTIDHINTYSGVSDDNYVEVIFTITFNQMGGVADLVAS